MRPILYFCCAFALLGVSGCADSESAENATTVAEPERPSFHEIAKQHVDSKLEKPGEHSDIFMEETGTSGGTHIMIVDGKVTVDGEASDWRVIVGFDNDLIYAWKVNGESKIETQDAADVKYLKVAIDKPKSKYARPLSDFGN